MANPLQIPCLTCVQRYWSVSCVVTSRRGSCPTSFRRRTGQSCCNCSDQSGMLADGSPSYSVSKSFRSGKNARSGDLNYLPYLSVSMTDLVLLLSSKVTILVYSICHLREPDIHELAFCERICHFLCEGTPQKNVDSLEVSWQHVFTDGYQSSSSNSRCPLS